MFSAPSASENGNLCDNGISWHEIIERLSWCGYHRARVHGLDEFNKVVGGLRWVMHTMHTHKIDFDEFPVKDDTNTDLFKKEARHLEMAVRFLRCPHQINPDDILNHCWDEIIDAITWLVDQMHKLDAQDDQYQKFAEFFDKEFATVDDAKKEYDVCIHRPSWNRDYDAAHWRLFDNGILFERDVSADIMLAGYIWYANHNKQCFPAKVVPKVEDSVADVAVKRVVYELSKQRAILHLNPLAVNFFSRNREEIESKVIEKMLATITKLDMGRKLCTCLEKMEQNACNYYEVHSETKFLEVQLELERRHTTHINVETHLKFQDKFECLMMNVYTVHTTTTKALQLAKELETETNSSLGEDETVDQTIRRQELIAMQQKKCEELDKITNEVSLLKTRLENTSSLTEVEYWYKNMMKCHRAMTNSHRDDFKQVEEGIVQQLQCYISCIEKAHAEVTATREYIGDAGERHRQMFTAYAADCRIALFDLYKKATIQVEKFKDVIRRRNKTTILLIQIQEHKMFVEEWLADLLEVVCTVDEVESALGEITAKFNGLMTQ